jgi:hypothetical protein
MIRAIPMVHQQYACRTTYFPCLLFLVYYISSPKNICHDIHFLVQTTFLCACNCNYIAFSSCAEVSHLMFSGPSECTGCGFVFFPKHYNTFVTFFYNIITHLYMSYRDILSSRCNARAST